MNTQIVGAYYKTGVIFGRIVEEVGEFFYLACNDGVTRLFHLTSLKP